MKDFFDALGEQIERAGRAEEEHLRRARARRQKVRPLLAAAGAALLVAVVLIAVRGSTPEKAFAGFPVLQRPITDASRISIAAELRRRGAKLTRAHAFSTAFGRGYALPTKGGGLCLAVPDGDDGFAKACETRAFAERHGVRITVVRSSAGAQRVQASFSVALPGEATAPIVILPDAGSRMLPIDRGVATSLVPPGATVRWSIRNRITQAAISRVPVGARKSGGSCIGSRGHAHVIPQPGAGRTSCR